MSKALEGVRILDLGHVQAAPTATQLLAWMGADVIKVELPGRGDITRGQLQDVKGADSLYFTMLNSNKRSITINLKTPGGKKILEELVRRSDIVVENFGPGVLDRQGFTWARFQELNPRIIYASIKGFGPGRYADFKAYENVAQCMGGAASTTGWDDGPPTVTGAQIGDSGTGMHLVAGILGALFQRERTGKGQRVEVAMTDAVLNLCRVKMRDQQRIMKGPLPEYPNKEFGDAVPRAGNASGGGQPGAALRCAPGGPNDYIYVIIQPPCWAPLMKIVGREELITDPDYATPPARLPHIPGMLRDHRTMDDDQDQERGHGGVERVRHTVRPDPVDEGHLRGQGALRARHAGRARPPDARALCPGRHADQPVGLAGRGGALAALGRAHRRGAGLARLRRGRDRQAARRRGRCNSPECPARGSGRSHRRAGEASRNHPHRRALMGFAALNPSTRCIGRHAVCIPS